MRKEQRRTAQESNPTGGKRSENGSGELQKTPDKITGSDCDHGCADTDTHNTIFGSPGEFPAMDF